MVQCLSDQDPSPKDLSSPVDPVPDFSQSINKSYRDYAMKKKNSEAVWPVKRFQMSIKVAQNDYSRTMKDFDNFTKIA